MGLFISRDTENVMTAKRIWVAQLFAPYGTRSGDDLLSGRTTPHCDEVYRGPRKAEAEAALRRCGSGQISGRDARGFCDVYRGEGLEARRGRIFLSSI